MKTLVAYYTRTGSSRRAAEEISARLNCSIAEIESDTDYNGVSGIFRIIRDSIFHPKRSAKLKSESESYERVIICAPVWMGKIAIPALSFLREKSERVRSISVVALSGGKLGEHKNAFKGIESIYGREPVKIEIFRNEIGSESYRSKIDSLIAQLK